MFTLNAVGGGYLEASFPVTVDEAGTENFNLNVDPVACTAPGYESHAAGVAEPFENDGGPPPGWTVVDNVPSGEVWPFRDPGRRGNLTGGTGGFATV